MDIETSAWIVANGRACGFKPRILGGSSPPADTFYERKNTKPNKETYYKKENLSLSFKRGTWAFVFVA